MLWSDEGRLATLSAAMMAMAGALSLSGTEAVESVEAALSAPGFNFAPALAGLDDRQAHRALLNTLLIVNTLFLLYNYRNKGANFFEKIGRPIFALLPTPLSDFVPVCLTPPPPPPSSDTFSVL